ncbi:MAG: TIGR03560 family F420-dependent LLM class oxidoreductase [Nitrospinota bacterium]|nr:MAG: TIGR03560 family F420-dependent LLM class oxidoreductase [Nitrospinota bacterium]
MPISFGVHVGQQNCPFHELQRVWQFADGSGFDWISVWDHFYESPPQDGNGEAFEAVAILTALAMSTTRARIGCLVFCMGYRHPAVLANAAVTIDHVSNGRLNLGLGAGWHEMEYRDYGIPFPPARVRLDMLEEGVQVIRSLLTQDRTTFQGTHYQLHNAACYPKPLQSPLPIWIGGVGEKRTLRIAARYADGWNAPYISPEQFRQKSQVLDRWCEQEGRDPSTILRTVNVSFHMGTSEAEAQRERDRARQQWGEAFSEREGGMLLGTPAQVIDRIGAYQEAGAARLNIALRAPFNWEALQAYSEEVIPAFR